MNASSPRRVAEGRRLRGLRALSNQGIGAEQTTATRPSNCPSAAPHREGVPEARVLQCFREFHGQKAPVGRSSSDGLRSWQVSRPLASRTAGLEPPGLHPAVGWLPRLSQRRLGAGRFASAIACRSALPIRTGSSVRCGTWLAIAHPCPRTRTPGPGDKPARVHPQAASCRPIDQGDHSRSCRGAWIGMWESSAGKPRTCRIDMWRMPVYVY